MTYTEAAPPVSSNIQNRLWLYENKRKTNQPIDS